jgi:hypothetical protein
MPKKQIEYNSDSNVLLFDIPPDWDFQNLDSITLQVKNVSGTELQAATSIGSLYSNTLGSAASSGDNSIVLNTDTAIIAGYRIRIQVDNGIPEDRTVISYTSATKTVVLDTVLDYDHAAGAFIYPITVSATLDTTTVASYPKNAQLQLIWNSDLAVAPYTELAEIAQASEFSPSDFDREFAALYPREYENARERLTDLRTIAEDRLKDRLYTRGMNMERVKDQRAIMPVLLSLTRWLTIQGYGDDWEFEIGQAWDNYLRDFEDLCALPIWVDDNQDDIQTEDEFYVFEPLMFGRNM